MSETDGQWDVWGGRRGRWRGSVWGVWTVKGGEDEIGVGRETGEWTKRLRR